MSFQLPTIRIKVMSRCMSAPDATSLHHCLQNHHLYFIILMNSGIGHYEAYSQPCESEFVSYMPSPFYPASAVLFQLHGRMVSHMQVLDTPSSTVHSTKYLDPYNRKHILLVLAACS